MKNKNKSVTDNTKKSEIKIVSSRYPGVDDALIIPSYPIYIRENRSTPSKKKIESKNRVQLIHAGPPSSHSSFS